MLFVSQQHCHHLADDGCQGTVSQQHCTPPGRRWLSGHCVSTTLHTTQQTMAVRALCLNNIAHHLADDGCQGTVSQQHCTPPGRRWLSGHCVSTTLHTTWQTMAVRALCLNNTAHHLADDGCQGTVSQQHCTPPGRRWLSGHCVSTTLHTTWQTMAVRALCLNNTAHHLADDGCQGTVSQQHCTPPGRRWLSGHCVSTTLHTTWQTMAVRALCLNNTAHHLADDGCQGTVSQQHCTPPGRRWRSGHCVSATLHTTWQTMAVRALCEQLSLLMTIVQ